MKIPRRRMLAALCLAAALPASAGEDATGRLIADLGLKESVAPVSERPGWRPPRRIVLPPVDAARLAWLREAVPGVELVAAADRADAARLAAEADGVVGYCTPEILAAGARLRWVQLLSAGVERCVGIPGFAERGLVLTNMQKVAGPVMSEHVLALVLGLSRGLATYVPAQARGEWADDAVPDARLWALEGKTMLVAGLGGIGTEVARRAHALGMTVVATRNSSTEGPPYVAEVGLPGDLLRLAARADVVVNALPLNDATRGLFDRRFFDAVKRGALFVNVGRGGSVVTDDLVAALADGRLGGAGLDVTDPEPLPAAHPLWRMPNVIITPHVAAGTDAGDEDRWIVVRENLRRYAAGGRLLSEVDTARGY